VQPPAELGEDVGGSTIPPDGIAGREAGAARVQVVR
jgi:hypothetical protein